MTNTSKFWVGALIVGAVATAVVITDRNRVEVTPAVPVAAAEPAQPTVTKAALPMPMPPTKKLVSRPLEMSVGLATLVKPLLQPGTDLAMASDGFASSELFVATAHAAKNLGVPFVLLKDRVVAQRMSLADAIRETKPDADAKSEAARATSEARSEIARPS